MIYNFSQLMMQSIVLGTVGIEASEFMNKEKPQYVIFITKDSSLNPATGDNFLSPPGSSIGGSNSGQAKDTEDPTILLELELFQVIGGKEEDIKKIEVLEDPKAIAEDGQESGKFELLKGTEETTKIKLLEETEKVEVLEETEKVEVLHETEKFEVLEETEKFEVLEETDEIKNLKYDGGPINQFHRASVS